MSGSVADPGEGPGGPVPPPLFLDQTEVRGAGKNFLETAPRPPLSQFLDDQPPQQPPPPPHPISRSGSGSGNDGFEIPLTTEVFNVVIVFIVSVLTK